MLADVSILLLLIEREPGDGLSAQIRRLRPHALDADQLSQLRQTWAPTLGHVNLMASLLEALYHLIDELEQGDYDPDAYDEVIYQVSLYRRASWQAIRRQLGSPRAYLDRWDKVGPHYHEQTRKTSTPPADLDSLFGEGNDDDFELDFDQ